MNTKKQKKWAFVPLLNFPVVFFSMAKNSSKLKPGWQFKMIIPLFGAIVIALALQFLFGLFKDYINSDISIAVSLYIASVSLSFMLIYWQKKNGIE